MTGAHRILVTGASGFLGKNLCGLLKRKYPCAALFAVDKKQKKSGIIECDLLSERAVKNLIKDVHPDYVFHAAGLTGTDNFQALCEANLYTTRNLLEAVRLYGDCRVILPGSAAEYGIPSDNTPIKETCPPAPITPYGLSKFFQTEAALYYRRQGVNVVIGRIFNLIGRGLGEAVSIGTFYNQLIRIRGGKARPVICAGNLKSKRDFIDVTDACEGLAGLAEKGKDGEIYNICSGAAVSVGMVLGLMVKYSGLRVKIILEPSRLRNADVASVTGCAVKIQKATGWKAVISMKHAVASLMQG